MTPRYLAVLLFLSLSPVFASEPPIDPRVTQANVRSTVCVPGYTRKVRPPTSYTNRIKYARLAERGLPVTRAEEYELDHAVALTIGGAPRDPRNLVLQPWPEARVKDKLEVRLNRLVCSGRMRLAEAQACMWNDWRACAANLKESPK